MTTIELDNKTHELPTSWDDVTVHEFQKIQTLLNSDMMDVTKSINIIALLLGVDVDTVEEFPISEFNKLQSEIMFISKAIVKPEDTEIIIDDVEYIFKSDFGSDLTVGESISLEMLNKSVKGNDTSSIISETLCIFLRKKLEDGTTEKFKSSHMSRESMFGELSITKVYYIITSFTTGRNI